jgi:hypothetical protein
MLGRIKFKYVRFYSSVSRRLKSPYYVKKIQSENSERINFQMVTLCGKNGFEDLTLSIYSFIRSVGKPIVWKIYSDGSITDKQKKTLSQIDFIQIEKFELAEEDVIYKKYIDKFPSAMKFFMLKYNNDKKRIFVDSDIVYFPRMKEYIQQLSIHSFYITDATNYYLDSNIVQKQTNYNPLNFGFIVLNEKIQFSKALRLLDNSIKTNQITYWTDQSICNIIFKEFAYALPYNEFLTGGNDSFFIKHNYNYKLMCLRHFVGPVRHKMWQYHWRKIFK